MTSTERIYLAGPMTGMPEWNFPAFHAATDRLRERGHIVCNPAERDADVGFDPTGMTGQEDLAELGFDLRQALHYDLSFITTAATRVVVLDGWERSKGARAEVATATAIGIEVSELDAFLRWDVAAQDLTSRDPETGPAGIGSTGEVLRTLNPQPVVEVDPLDGMPPIVGITGRKRSGKNTAADALVAMGYELGGFADELKDAALDLDPWISYPDVDDVISLRLLVDSIGWERAKDEHPDVRRILQRLGTDVVRNRDPEFWLKAFDRRQQFDDGNAPHLVIADVRFDNEAQWIRDRGGIVLEIVRPSQGAPVDAHASEAGVSPLLIDYSVVNASTVESLRALTANTVRYHLGERAA